MTLAAVVGQPRAVEVVRSALRGGSVHHGYLFGGPEGVGKELLAVGLAQALNCEDAPNEGCGTCSACLRITRRNYPDVTWVMPEDELVTRGLAGRSDFNHTPSREIRVEQIRALQERLAFRALEGRRKVAIIASAQAMNVQAQNAFLKTLEEPPAQTVLVLLASSPDRLLPTIRSRCSKVHFGPLPRELLAAKVKEARGDKVDHATAELVAVIAGGSLSRALALDLKSLARRREVIERFEALEPQDAKTWLQFAEDFGASRDDAEDCLRILAVWGRDLAAAKAGADGLANSDLRELSIKAAGRQTEEALHRRLLLIDQALNAIVQRNGGARLQLERMLIEIKTRER